MVWVRLSDDIDEHRKMAALDDHAFALFVAGLAYCNRNLTDGFIPNQVGLGQLRWCDGNAVPAIRQLETAGMWITVEGGWNVHDYLDYQPSRQKVLEDREKSAERAVKRRAKTRGEFARTSDYPVPVPGPVPVPKTAESKTAPSPSADYFDTGKWQHLLDALHQRGWSDTGKGALTWAFLMKMRQAYGSRVVDSALSDANLDESAPAFAAAPYFRSICERFSSVKATA